MKLSINKRLFILSNILGVLAIVYCLKGSYHLFLNEVGPIDLQNRWTEQQYIYQGNYPYHVGKNFLQVDPEIGPVNSGGYFPWSFFTGFIFFPPVSFSLVRLYHLMLNVTSLFIIGYFAYDIGAKYGKQKGWFAVTGTLAISAHATTLGLGQYGIIINALLIIMFWLLQAYKDQLAGLIYGIVLAKPNVTALYFFVAVARRQYWFILMSFSYVSLASFMIWQITQENPIDGIIIVLNQSEHFGNDGYSGVNFLVNLGLETQTSVILMSLITLGIITLIFNQLKDYSLLTQFAFASVFGRIWTYHRAYDNVMLMFLFLALLVVALREPIRLNRITLMLVGISLWIPARFLELPGIETAQLVIWMSSLVVLIIYENQVGDSNQFSK